MACVICIKLLKPQQLSHQIYLKIWLSHDSLAMTAADGQIQHEATKKCKVFVWNECKIDSGAHKLQESQGLRLCCTAAPVPTAGGRETKV